MSLRCSVRVAASLSVLAFTSCMSTTTEVRPSLDDPMETRLPYRVALIPVTAEAGDPGLWRAFTQDLHEALEGEVFNDVVVLPAAASGEDNDDHWRRAALAADADLLINVDSALIDEAPKSSAIWSSYALFLTGPLEIVFPDRHYKVGETHASLSVYDVNLLGEPTGAGPSDDDDQESPIVQPNWRFPRAALLRELRVKPEDFSLRYGDRAEGGLGVGAVLKSFVVPTAHLSEDTPTAQRKITNSLSASLARNVAARIAENDEQYLRRPNPRMALFHVMGEPQAVLSSSGELQTVEVGIEANKNVSITDGRLRLIGTRVEVPFVVGSPGVRAASTKAFGELAPSSTPGSYSLRVSPGDSQVGVTNASASTKENAAEPQWVQLILSGNLTDGTQIYTRSWTLPVVHAGR